MRAVRKGRETSIPITEEAQAYPIHPPTYTPTYLVVMCLGRLHDANVLHPGILQLRRGSHACRAPTHDEDAVPLPSRGQGRRGGQRAHERGQGSRPLEGWAGLRNDGWVVW